MSGKVQDNFSPDSHQSRKIVQQKTKGTIMKQPELGKKISELRKAKGLTQEDLVEKCNISVRTIQRIESGEVTPRIYTVKTILSALDYDISSIREEDNGAGNSIIDWFLKFLILDSELTRSPDYVKRQLMIAVIAGLINFVLGFLKGAAEHFRYEELSMIFSNSLYTILNIIILISFIYMQRGFIILGSLFQNYLLRIVSYLLIFGNILIIGYDVASIYYNAIERQFILGAEAITFGGIGIIYGIALFRLKNKLGDAAKYAGVLEVIVGFFLITVFLAFIGLIIEIPAGLLEIVILYKGLEIVRENYEKDNSLPIV